MRTPFRDSERTAAQETGEQENLQKATLLEANEAKIETEKVDIPENSEVPENKAGTTTDVDDNIVDDNGNAVNEGNSLPPNKTFVLNGIEYKTDDNGKVFSIDGELLPNQTYYLDGHEYKTDDNGKVYGIDGKLSPNQVYCLDGCEYSTDDVGRRHMHPPVNVKFTCRDKYDRDEYKRQVDNQEKGMNKLTLYDYLKNREGYKNRASYKESGRDDEVGKPAQEKARQEAYKDRIAENRRNGMSREDAENEANQWIESQAALHDPDQIAGGDAANVTGMGDKNINSSIGAQWQFKIDAVDQTVQEYIDANSLSENDLKTIYLNVNLEVNDGE